MEKKRSVLLILPFLVILLSPMLFVPKASALTETILGGAYSNNAYYYSGHLVSNGFGISLSIWLPVTAGQYVTSHMSFAAACGNSWTTGSGTSYSRWTPYVANMWMQVSGPSNYWPIANVIVTNTGTGGTCTSSFQETLDWILQLLSLILELVRSTPPNIRWDNVGVHAVKAVATDVTGGLLTNPRYLKTACADFSVHFTSSGTYTLTVTAGCDVWLEQYRPFYRDGVSYKNYVGSYSVSFTSAAINVGA